MEDRVGAEGGDRYLWAPVYEVVVYVLDDGVEGELRVVEVRGMNGRRIAVFQIEGAGMVEAERNYYRGAAEVDLRLLKTEVKRLKDLAFAAIREEEKRDANHPRTNAIYKTSY